MKDPRGQTLCLKSFGGHPPRCRPLESKRKKVVLAQFSDKGIIDKLTKMLGFKGPPMDHGKKKQIPVQPGIPELRQTVFRKIDQDNPSPCRLDIVPPLLI